MLSIRKCLVVVSPLKNCVFFATRAQLSKRLPRGGGPKRAPRSDVMFGHNPGVQGQISALGLTEQELNDPNVLEDMEKQFWDVDKVGDQIDRADHVNKELLEIYQIQRKQLKEEKSPNMLLWDEKQEIKTLHANEPEKWTVMRLAFSYPASPAIIKKVLKSKMKLRRPEEIERHDQRVRRNWEEFSKGKLHFPNKCLEKHLMAFSERDRIQQTVCKEISGIPDKDFNPVSNILKDGGVFSNIYQSYKKATQVSNSEEILDKDHENSIEVGLKKLHRPPENDTFIIPNSVQNVRMRTTEPQTLETMRAKVMRDAVEGKELGADEKSFVQDHLHKEIKNNFYKQVKDPIGITPKKEHIDTDNHSSDSGENSVHSEGGKVEVLFEHSNRNSSTQDFPATIEDTYVDNASKFVDLSNISDHQHREDEELQASLRTAKIERSKQDNAEIVKAVKDYVMESSEGYPMQIIIPKDLWQKDKLYRVKDCFYTNDGEFLYRVPGLCKD